MRARFRSNSLKAKDHFQELDVDGTIIIFTMDLKKIGCGLEHLPQSSDH
jgi:hypothetical protein